MIGSSEEGRHPLVARAALVAREVLWLLVYGVLSIAMTWPLVRHLSRAASDPGDPYLNTWILHWDWFATFTEAPLYHANIFFPAQWTLAFSETLYGIALLTFPLRFAGVDPLTTYNVAMIAGFALSGYGAHVLARVMLERWLAGGPLREICSFVAGLFFAFVPFRFEHLSHLQHIWAGWIPLLLAALLLLLRKPRLSVALAFVSAYVMNGLSNVHWLLFTAITVPLFAVALMGLEQRLRDRRTWVWLGSSFLLANLLLLPFLLPYSIASNLYGLERGTAETSGYSARVWDWAVGGSMNRTWDHLNEDLRESERLLFPGFAVLILSVVPLLVRKRAESDRENSNDSPDQPRRGMLLRILDLVVIASLIIGFESLSDKAHPTIESLRERSVPWVVFWTALLVRGWIRYPAWLNTRCSSLGESVRRAKMPVEYWVALSIVVLGVIGSFGLNGFFHSFLYSTLEPFRSLRVPARWAMISYCGLAVTAAIGAAFLLGRLQGWNKTAVAALLPLVMLAELRAAPIVWHLEEIRA
ncbi:MAG: hypothetical protein KY432_01515, partial [Acidobacteria bacterium]|nr:hypothetical protein [Acidobacteriota bacterium]